MKRQPAAPYDGPTTLGIDVSKWQGEIDWAQVASSTARCDGEGVGRVRFVVVRSGDGKDVDPMAVRNLSGAVAAGLPVAVYHYLRAKRGLEVQIKIIREVIELAGVPIGFVAIDIEGGPTTRDRKGTGAWLDASTGVVALCVDLLGLALEGDGYRVVIYSGQAWHFHIAQRGISHRANRWPLWTASYTSRPEPKVPMNRDGSPAWDPDWTIWQFAGSTRRPGYVGGIQGVVDLNRFRGGLKSLRAWMDPAHGPPAQPAAFDREEIMELAVRAKASGDVEAAEQLQSIIRRLAKR